MPVDRRRIWPATEWYFTFSCIHSVPIPVAARSKAWVYGRSLAGIAGLNSDGGMDFSLGSVVWCQEAVSVTGWSLVQRSPTECSKTKCDRGTSQRRPTSTRIVEPWAKKRQRERALFNDAMSTIEIKHHTLRYGTSTEVKWLTANNTLKAKTALNDLDQS